MGDKSWLTKFVYTKFRCKVCSYYGKVEIEIPYLVKDKEQTVFNIGDKVQEGYAGIIEHFDGFYCPECLKNKRIEIKGVRIILEDGIFTRCIFE